MSENDSDMIYGLWDKPPIFELILLSLQRLCAIFGATILVPIVVNTTVGEPVLSVPVALIASGIGTLIYVIVSSCFDCFRDRYTYLCNCYTE